MTDKNLQKHEKSIATLESKLGSLESVHVETKEQLGKIEEKFDLQAAGMQRSIDELKELMKAGFNTRPKEPGEGSSATTPFREKALATVSSVPSTPTHFGTVNDVDLRLESGKSTPWERSGSVPKPLTHPLQPKPIPPTTMDSVPFSHPGFHPGYIPIHTLHPNYPFQTQSTLNPYALPLYPHYVQTSNIPAPPIYTNTTVYPATTHIAFSQPITQAQPHTPFSTAITQPHLQTNRLTHPYSTYKGPKLDFPKFDGQDPRSWLSKCDKFFQLNPPSDERAKVLCAAIYLEGEANIWYRSVEIEKPQLLWPEFV